MSEDESTDLNRFLSENLSPNPPWIMEEVEHGKKVGEADIVSTTPDGLWVFPMKPIPVGAVDKFGNDLKGSEQRKNINLIPSPFDRCFDACDALIVALGKHRICVSAVWYPNTVTIKLKQFDGILSFVDARSDRNFCLGVRNLAVKAVKEWILPNLKQEETEETSA